MGISSVTIPPSRQTAASQRTSSDIELQSLDLATPVPSEPQSPLLSSMHRPEIGGLLRRRNSLSAAEAGHPHWNPEVVIGDENTRKLKTYQRQRPRTSLIPCIGKRLPCTDPEQSRLMAPFEMGACWGGAAFRRGASNLIASRLEEGTIQEVFGTLGDVHILGKRQRLESAALGATKIAGAALLWLSANKSNPMWLWAIRLALTALPGVLLESTANAHQMMQLARSILQENNMSTETLDKIDLHQMTLARLEETTPIRHSLQAWTNQLPVNTTKTRAHLFKVFPVQQHAGLRAIIEAPGNYVPLCEEIGAAENPVEGRVFCEKGWQKIISLALEARAM